MTGTNCKCNVKSWLIKGFVVAVLYLGLDMFFHGYCMHKLYHQYASLFRPMDMIMHKRWIGYAGYLIYGLLFVCIYSKGYEEGKSAIVQGLRFGLLIGLFFWGAHLLLSYPYMPWPKRLYAGWFVIGVFENLVLGAILGGIYKPTPTS